MSRVKYDYWKRKEPKFFTGGIVEAPKELDLVAMYEVGEIYNSDGDILA